MNKIIFKQASFTTSVTDIAQLPNSPQPEVALIGRSNVGKSSLLNALVGHGTLAKTSNTPGRTRMLNFFSLGDDEAFLVDVPGYGYAKAGKKEKAGWQGLIHDYLRGRLQLKRALLLIDGRHGIKANDHEMLTYLDDVAVPCQIVLTKSDKLKKSEADATHQAVELALKTHACALPQAITTSSKNGTGLDTLRGAVLAAMTGV